MEEELGVKFQLPKKAAYAVMSLSPPSPPPLTY